MAPEERRELESKLRAVSHEIATLEAAVKSLTGKSTQRELENREHLQGIRGAPVDLPDQTGENYHGRRQPHAGVISTSSGDNDESGAVSSMLRTSCDGGKRSVALQLAISKQRLDSLRGLRTELKSRLENAGEEPCVQQGTDPVRNGATGAALSKDRGKHGANTSSRGSLMAAPVLLEGGSDLDSALDAAAAARSQKLVETDRDRLIRTGLITPFHQLAGFHRSVRQSGSSASGGASGAPGSLPGGAAGSLDGDAGRQPGSLASPVGADTSRGSLAGSADEKQARVGPAAGPVGRSQGSQQGAGGRSGRRGAILLAAGEAPAVGREAGGRGEWGLQRRAPPGSASGGGAQARRKRRRVGARPLPAVEWRKRSRGEQRGEEEEDGQEEEEEWGGEELEDASGSEGEAGLADQRPGTGSAAEVKREEGEGEGDGAAGAEAGRGACQGDVEPSVELEGGLRVPGEVHRRLLGWQRVGLQWLWELHCQQVGGILGDEMGLGKTVQVAAFLAALRHSRMVTGPWLVVCPVTLLRQWAREIRKWCAGVKTVILHESAWRRKEERKEEEDEGEWESADEREEDEKEDEERSDEDGGGGRKKSQQRAKSAAKRQRFWQRALQLALEPAWRGRAVAVLTTYEQLRLQRDGLLYVPWMYAVLDEGHRIRNPDAETTLVCKQLRTPHRLLLSGSPIQNRLTELWSLMDFVHPGRLGTLPVFTTEFALPIAIGGYRNASPLQVTTAFRCAVLLRDIIGPFLLRRLKADVDLQLPPRTERVLLCRLAPRQLALYRSFLESAEVQQILERRRNALFGIDVLRKICNHPDLLLLGRGGGEGGGGGGAGGAVDEPEGRGDRRRGEAVVAAAAREAEDEEQERHSGMGKGKGEGRGADDGSPGGGGGDGDIWSFSRWREEGRGVISMMEPEYGSVERSTKLQVLEKLLSAWHSQGHRALLFCQTQQMLDIVEALVAARGFCYRRMDGATPPGLRTALIDEFNAESSPVFVFLLTTRVGGLGTNLTAANRVVIFDPDWNPATDMQARERAWRIGQRREVAIYRLLTRGTIEERVFHRQLAKQLLSSSVLANPRQRRLFNPNELRDLFSLKEDDEREEEDGEEGGQSAGSDGRRRNGALPGNGYRMGAEELLEEAAGVKVVSPEEEKERLRERGEQQPKVEEGEAAGDEAKILRQLLDGKAVHSALDQAAVERMAEDDRQRADAQASAVARRAASALRASQAACAQFDVAQPTWTGRSGAAGGPARPAAHAGRFGRSGFGASNQGGSNVARPGMPGVTGVLSSAQVMQRLRRMQSGIDAEAEGGRERENARGNREAGGDQAMIPAAPSGAEMSAELKAEQVKKLQENIVQALRNSGKLGLSSTELVSILSAKVGPQVLADMTQLRSTLGMVAKQQHVHGQLKWVLQSD